MRSRTVPWIQTFHRAACNNRYRYCGEIGQSEADIVFIHTVSTATTRETLSESRGEVVES